HHQIQDAVRGPISLLRLAEPVGKNAIFGETVQNSVRTDDRGVHRSGQHQDADKHNKYVEDQAQGQRPDQVHRQAANQVFLELPANGVRDDHHRKEGRTRGEDQAVKENDPGGFLQVGKLRVLDFAIHLSHGFLAAHRENGMAQSNQDSNETNRVRKRTAVQPAQRASVVTLVVSKVVKAGQRWKMRAAHPKRVTAPYNHDDDHRRRNLHDAQGFFAGLRNTLDVFPPEVERTNDRENRRRGVLRQHDFQMYVREKFVQ